MKIMTRTNSGVRRSERISVRVTSAQKEIIQRAATSSGKSIATFVLSEIEAVARRIVQPRASQAPGKFEVLCRIDAFADYVTQVEAEDAEEAAALAHDNHDAYRWEHNSTQEFDACLYVTLDGGGNEIEKTQIGDL